MIEALQARDVPVAAEVLAQAFRDNPGFLALLRGDSPEVRLRLVRRAMRGFTAAVHRYGVAEVVREDGRISAVSLAFPPRRFPPPLLAELIVATGPLSAGPRRAMRFARFDREVRKRHPRGLHWYLWMLGVEPERQGHGLGSALLRSLSARADGEGMPCYLETDRASNVPLYARHGYTLLGKEVLSGLDLELWFMQRAART